MINRGPQPVLAPTCLLGESPVWDAALQLICWVDILQGSVHQYSMLHNKHGVITVDQMIGAIGLCENGNFIAALQHGFGFIDRNTQQVKMITDPETDLPANRFNEGKCAPDGRFWAGTMSLQETPAAGNLYCLQPDLSVAKKISGVSISNGLAWSLDHRVLYYIDSPTLEVAAYDYDTTTGSIKERKVVIKIPGGEGFPDGMTIDDEGMLWIAFWDGWKVARWNPHNGKKLLEIYLPVSKVTSCVFGGPGMDDLFITTAAKDLSDQELKEQPLAGTLFVIENCGFGGVAGFRFREA